MKDTGNDINYLSIMEEYAENQSEMMHIREEVAPYLSSKQQGEYTLEDYYAIPDEYRVELIDGVIYDMATPTVAHQIVLFVIGMRLVDYIERKKGKCIMLQAPMDVQLDCDNRTMLQPDVSVTCNRDKLKKRNVYGAPDLVVEILSPSTRKKDMTIKKEKYEKAGVREYWMVDIDNEKIIVHEFEKGNVVTIYSFADEVPVGIFCGDCQVGFAEIAEKISFLKEEI